MKKPPSPNNGGLGGFSPYSRTSLPVSLDS